MMENPDNYFLLDPEQGGTVVPCTMAPVRHGTLCGTPTITWICQLNYLINQWSQPAFADAMNNNRKHVNMEIIMMEMNYQIKTAVLLCLSCKHWTY